MLNAPENHLHLNALAAAKQEQMLQFQAAMDFDTQHYEVGDRVEWYSRAHNLEGTGILTIIGAPIIVTETTEDTPSKWKGSMHVQLEVTECRLKVSPKKSRRTSTVVISAFYKKGQLIELRKGEVRRRIRKISTDE